MRVDLKQKIEQPKKIKVSGIIHNVHILDSSYSMKTNNKYNNAIEGINSDINNIREESKKFSNIKSTISLVEFSSFDQIMFRNWLVPIEKDILITKNLIGRDTALYQTIGETIEKLLNNKEKEDKVLLKIFTDGQENGSKGKYASTGFGKYCPTLANLIKKVEKEDNFTITFVGTPRDTTNIASSLSIDLSNTLSYDNTGAGVRRSFEKTIEATQSYYSGASAREDVSKGFYTKTAK